MVMMVEYELVKRRPKEPLQRSCSFNAYDLVFSSFPFIATSTVCHKQNKKVNNNNELGREGRPSPSTKGRIQDFL